MYNHHANANQSWYEALNDTPGRVGPPIEHTSAEDAGRVARAAGVKTLVLSHLVPADDPAVTDPMWIDAARKHFTGTIVVGKDLLEIWREVGARRACRSWCLHAWFTSSRWSSGSAVSPS
jgi:ribonuclease BN (tRNA processing enzyme)